MVETVYSVFKRCFGEFVSAKKEKYMVKVIAAKMWITQFVEGCVVLRLVGCRREEGLVGGFSRQSNG